MGWKEVFYLGDRKHIDSYTYYYRQSVFQLFRPLTLSGSISPILVGTALALQKGKIHLLAFIVVLVAAISVQIAVNIFNDYFDFANGQDSEKWTLNKANSAYYPAYKHLPYIAGLLLIIAFLLGIYLAFFSTVWLVIIGLCSIIFGYAYSAGKNSLAARGLGELVAFVFLGYIVTFVSYIVQGYHLDLQIFIVGTPFALLIASMILTNNLRDMEKDRGFRRTLVIIYGRAFGVKLLTSLLILSYVWIVLFIMMNKIPLSSLLVCFAFPLAIRLRYSFRQNATRREEIKAMKTAALHHWVFGLLFSFGIFIWI